MKVSEFIAQFVADLNAGGKTRVYGICGAGAMHLNDALANHPGIDMIAMQHEQAATFAAEADARVTGNIGVVSVTAGPGGSNTVTGLATAYVDSIPLLVIAGQVTTDTMIGTSGARQRGMNELNMTAIVRPVTKYAVTVRDPAAVAGVLAFALQMATTGRPGPVWVEIPLDVQAAEISVTPAPASVVTVGRSADQVGLVRSMLEKAHRPLIIAGNGIRLAKAEGGFRQLVDRLQIPVVTSWGGADLLPSDHSSHIGHCGIFGDRASNFAVQTADVILVIGSSMTVAQTGHNRAMFAPKAKIIVVDADSTGDLFRSAALALKVDAGAFLAKMIALEPWQTTLHLAWAMQCAALKNRYRTEVRPASGGVSSYAVIETLSRYLDDDAIIVTDVGFCYIPTFQTLRLKAGQRLIHSHGVSPMGWAIPAAVGAALSSPGRQVVCLTGDGGAMLNIQELATIAARKLPIAIFVYENGGYATMKITQNNHFGREVMAGPDSGMVLPDLQAVATGFGIANCGIDGHGALVHSLGRILDGAREKPILTVLHMDKTEVIAPRVQARTDENGQFIPGSIENMWPYLPAEEIQTNMRGPDVVERFDAIGSEVVGAK